LFGAVLWLIGATALAQASDDVERGRDLYMRNGCYSCHGTVGQGGERSGSPKLAPETYPFEVFKLMVRTPREAMPRFDPRYVSDEDLLAMHRYLSAQPKSTAAREIPALQSLMR
jgi:ubiquinol-cytochrome c reductase cytochrome c subunit